MSDKIACLLKALLFAILGAIALYMQFTTTGKVWPLIGFALCVVLVVGYLKQAFGR